MSKISTADIIKALSELGRRLAAPNEALTAAIEAEQYHNAWFTPQSVHNAVTATGQMLNANDLQQWLSRYDLSSQTSHNIGCILAGNIPLVGFHDVLCILVSGKKALIKASSQDARLIRYILDILCNIEPYYQDRYTFVERLAGFDAVIATGSNNSSRYFDHYFGKVPNIIRKNRNSIALLTGSEPTEELQALGRDVFTYFGLGCRNVSKLLVPKGYDFTPFFEAIEEHKTIIHHHKYSNNYDYNKSIYLVNRDNHLDNGFLMLKQDERLASPLAVLYYEEYDSITVAERLLRDQTEQLQCVVTSAKVDLPNQVAGFGESQHPRLWDYADGVDTMEFLVSLG